MARDNARPDQQIWQRAVLTWQKAVPFWQRQGIVVAGSGPLRWARLELNGRQMVMQIPSAGQKTAQEHCEILLHSNEVVALKNTDGEVHPLCLDRFGASIELLRREWMLSLFLFGPILGVFLVNLIFGMPTFLWWTALGVLGFSLAIMASLLRRDLQNMQGWLQSRQKYLTVSG
ncbi:hypothetical protein MQE22_11030 [Acidithiobacillus sp. YTS05]|uniref:hypothetical protein n=1 Tax=Igneacidithiobacillus copahuensis TaxID=2724909 RepID=UPI001C074FCD|nr:hypothetical protein [Igneacidithiobacillus copahuensis]UTV80536.1 hypothetical protein MQE22_11030 [Acidithiobacillus sp. YTS05]